MQVYVSSTCYPISAHSQEPVRSYSAEWLVDALKGDKKCLPLPTYLWLHLPEDV
jgi:hypothetical protein